MSSLQENNSTVPLDAVVNKRKAAFARSDSFDKFHYTAFYALQLAGTLLSQKSLLQIADELQYKSRVIVEKYVVQTMRPAFNKIYVVILTWIDAIARYTGRNVVIKKTIASNDSAEPEKAYSFRVQNQKTPEIANGLVSSAENHKATESVDEKRLKLIAEFDALHPHLRHSPTGRTWKSHSDTDSEMGSNTSISQRQNLGMVVIVYASATLAYIQLMFLAAFLQTAATPPGLLFLVFSLGYIAYIVYKMCFVKTKSKDEISSPSRAVRSTKASTDDTVGELPVKRNGRLSRSSTRRFLYFHNKTLSKIKLL